MKNLKIKNAQQIHISFQKSVNVQASNLVVTAPEKSPNTDGIHITDTQNIQITSCVIGTGMVYFHMLEFWPWTLKMYFKLIVSVEIETRTW